MTISAYIDAAKRVAFEEYLLLNNLSSIFMPSRKLLIGNLV